MLVEGDHSRYGSSIIRPLASAVQESCQRQRTELKKPAEVEPKIRNTKYQTAAPSARMPTEEALLTGTIAMQANLKNGEYKASGALSFRGVL